MPHPVKSVEHAQKLKDAKCIRRKPDNSENHLPIKNKKKLYIELSPKLAEFLPLNFYFEFSLELVFLLQ